MRISRPAGTPSNQASTYLNMVLPLSKGAGAQCARTVKSLHLERRIVDGLDGNLGALHAVRGREFGFHLGRDPRIRDGLVGFIDASSAWADDTKAGANEAVPATSAAARTGNAMRSFMQISEMVDDTAP